jgi:hypothetical protein
LQRGIDLPDAERHPGRIPIMGSLALRDDTTNRPAKVRASQSDEVARPLV